MLRLPQRSGRRRRGRRRRQRVRLRGVRERPIRQRRPFVLERAPHHRADGRRLDRAFGARDDGGPSGDPRRRRQTGLRVGPGGARRPRQQGRAVRLDRRPSRRDRRPRLGRWRRLGSHCPPVQPQGRVHLAAPVHHQRAQHPSRHGGVGALRRALDRHARLRRERRARRDHAGRRLGVWSPSRRPCRRRPSGPTCPTTGAPRRRKARGSSTRSAVRRAM